MEFEGRCFDCNTSADEVIYQAYFNSTTLSLLQVNGTDLDDYNSSSLLMQQNTTLCVPGRTKYTVNNTWMNKAQSRTFSMEPIDQLMSLVVPTYGKESIVLGFCAAS